MSDEKLCVFCKHWSFSGGSRGYSEMTPGTDATMDCHKGHFKPDEERLFDMDTADFRRIIEQASTCPDYKVAKP